MLIEYKQGLYISPDGYLEFILFDESDNSVGGWALSSYRGQALRIDKESFSRFRYIGDCKKFSFLEKLKIIYLIMKGW